MSYAEADNEWVETHLLAAFKQAGIHYYSEKQFTLGELRIDQFESAIKNSKRTLLVLSKAYMADDIAPFISRLAQHYDLDKAKWSVIPLVLDAEVELPLRLNALVK